VLLGFALVLGTTPALHAQTTATISGTVFDANGSVVANASVTLRNEATSEKRDTVTNSDGVFVFPALNVGTYTVKIQAKGFKTLSQTGIVLNAADSRKLTGLNLAVGGAQETITVEESNQVIPTDNGSRAALLDTNDIDNLALGSRDLSELLKVLPGVTITPNGTNASPNFNFATVGAAGSADGNGLNPNGVPNRGGTYQLIDGVDVDDPGCDCNSIATVNPDMTAQVSVQTSNFGADSPYGPAVINTISKSAGAEYHGEGYIYARNDVMDANDWQTKHQYRASHPTGEPPAGIAHYYYPGGNVSGPIPFTHKKLQVWGGYERILQNTGNSTHLTSFIPTPDMMGGNFTATTANQNFCLGNQGPAVAGKACNDLTGTFLPDSTTLVPDEVGVTAGRTAGMIPTAFLDPGAKALASFWPAANVANPSLESGNYNYDQVVPGVHDGWTYRVRADYHFSDSTNAYISYQQGYDQEPSSGAGAHIYWTPGNSVPYPGGGLVSTEYVKALSGHFVHTFTPTLTNEFIAAWGYGNFPVGPSNPSGAYKTTLGYPLTGGYGTVFNAGSKLVPSYNSAGNFNFPDFSESDIFEPSGKYLVRKEMPSFADNITKVWGKNTVKIGAFAENTGNIQGAFSSENGFLNSFSFGGTMFGNLVTGNTVGSPNNPTANFLMGLMTSYTENNSAPVSDMAFQTFAVYFDNSWKASKKLTVEYGIRLTHMGHWYDRQQLGMADFFPGLVQSDYAAGKFDPGAYWHGINPGVPNSGQPDRFVSPDPRVGTAYDLFGNGKTVLRGGWGIYRFADQYNDYTGALTTAQSVLTYNSPGSKSIFLQQLGNAAMLVPSTSCFSPCQSGSFYADTPGDYKQPYTTTWNFTISQQLHWNSLVEVAYVGNSSHNLVPGGQSISGSGFGDYINVNKVPMGAFFKPDPVTGLTATNPENVTSTCAGLICNKPSDYRPYGKEYGDATISVENNDGYGDYHAMQITWVKRSKDLNFNANYTWSKSLGTALTVNPFKMSDNYGVENVDRPQVVNLSASYTFERSFNSKAASMLINGWTISNYTTWQSGGNLQADNSPNFSMGLQYATNNGVAITHQGLSQSTYYGTNASIDVMPIPTCKQLVYTCFSAPAIQDYTALAGGQHFPYFHGPAYMDSDLTLFKTFPVVGKQNVRFQIEAFNWLNHPLNQYSGGSQISLHYNADLATKALSVDTADYPNGGTPSAFGVYDQKNGAPNQRILELTAKYNF
jgi:hypothetical protein